MSHTVPSRSLGVKKQVEKAHSPVQVYTIYDSLCMIYTVLSVKQACTTHLSTYTHNKTDPDLRAGVYVHGAVHKGGPCKCAHVHLI